MTRAIPFLKTPLVLAPIAGPGTVELTAAALNAGAFSFLACAYSDSERMRDKIARVRRLTGEPFGVNLFVDDSIPNVDNARLSRANERLNSYRAALGIPAPEAPPRPQQRYREQLAVVLEARPRAFSFTFGIPEAADIAALKSADIFTIGTATCVEEAVLLERAGIDAICAQGAEAGGHRGSFLNPEDPPLIGTFALVPLVVDAVSVPVFAAGGITDGRGVAAALALGASAAFVGTGFLRATEAQTPSAYRERLARASSSDTVLTRAFSGRTARGIANRMTRELAADEDRAPYPYQNALTRDIRNAAAARGESEYLSLWAGQAFPLARGESAVAIVERLLRETSEAVRRAQSCIP